MTLVTAKAPHSANGMDSSPAALPLWLRRAAWFSLVLCAAVMFGCVVWFQPYWGLIDDHGVLRELESLKSTGFWGSMRQGVAREVTWGGMRFIYPLVVWCLYVIPDASTQVFYLGSMAALWALEVFCVVVLWRSLVRPSLTAEAPAPPTRDATVVGLLLVLSYFWFHDYAWVPIYPERYALLWGCGLMGLLAVPRVQRLGNVAFALLFLPLFLFGFVTKPQFMSLVPAIVLLQAAADREAGRMRAPRAILLAAATVPAVAALKYFTAHGTYTGQFNAGRLVDNLASPFPYLLLGMAGLLGVVVVRHQVGLPWLAPPRLKGLGLPLALVAFVAVLLPRGLAGYILAFPAPILAVAAVGATLMVAGRRGFVALAVVAVVAAPLVSTYRSVRAFARLADIGDIVRSPVLAHMAETGVPLHVPCEEGAVALRFYIQNLQGVPLEVVYRPTGEAQAGAIWFGDARNCVVPQALAGKMGPLEVVHAARFQGGFQLWRVPGALEINGAR